METTILHQKFHSLLDKANRILLVAHKGPDADTLGSSGAILNYLLGQGKTVNAFCLDAVPEKYQYMSGLEHFTTDPNVFKEEHDLVCVFDSGDLAYAGVADFMKDLPGKLKLANIDHHATNQHYGDLSVVFSDASSTAEIVYGFFRANNLLIDSHTATCLLSGIFEDTMFFSNLATNAVCIEAASHLLICGGRLNEVADSLGQGKRVAVLQLWGRAFERIRENKKLGMASTVILKKDLNETGLDLDEAASGISNFLGIALKVPITLVLIELPDGFVRGSLRSATRDISEIAKKFGGGGHEKAAGFTIKGKVVEKDGIWQVESSR